MKHLIIFLMALPCMLSAKALLRETSQLQNRVQAPPDNELVFARGDDGTVTAYVGINGAACQVIDESAVRVARATPFDASEIYIDTTDATTVDVDGRVAYKGTVICTNIHKNAIGRVEVEQHQLGGAALPVSNECQVDIDGYTATITITGGGPGLFLTVYPAVLDTSVDLTKEDVTITDTLGSIRLSQLREDMLKRVQGNLGKDWSSYPAAHTVNLADQTVVFGPESGSALQGSAGQIALYAGAQPAIVAESTGSGGSVTSGTILITDFVIGASSVTLSVVANGIPVEALTLQHSATLTNATWLACPSTTITANADGSLTVSAPRTASDKTGFWRLVADDTVSTVVTVNGDLNVLGGVIMRSPNGSKWRISVTDNGTLSVTGV